MCEETFSNFDSPKAGRDSVEVSGPQWSSSFRPRLLTVDEIAVQLRVSPWTVRGWCSKKYIPFLKLRGCVRFRQSDVEAWLKKNTSPGRSRRRLAIEEAMDKE